MFHRLSKHLEFRQKYSAARRIFNSLLVFGYPDETLSLVFDILLTTPLLKKTKVNCLEQTCAQERKSIHAYTGSSACVLGLKAKGCYGILHPFNKF